MCAEVAIDDSTTTGDTAAAAETALTDAATAPVAASVAATIVSATLAVAAARLSVTPKPEALRAPDVCASGWRRDTFGPAGIALLPYSAFISAYCFAKSLSRIHT